MVLSKRAINISEKEQIILNSIQELEQPLEKNKQDKKELMDRVQFLTKSLATLRIAIERYRAEGDSDAANTQQKRFEKFELELKERNKNIEEVNLIIKNIEQKILQLKGSLDEATEQKSQIEKKPKEKATKVIPKKETIETEEIEVKEEEVSEVEKSFTIAAEQQAILEKELNFAALQQAEEQARIEYKLAEDRLRDCREGFSYEDIDESEEWDEDIRHYYEKIKPEREG